MQNLGFDPLYKTRLVKPVKFITRPILRRDQFHSPIFETNEGG